MKGRACDVNKEMLLRYYITEVSKTELFKTDAWLFIVSIIVWRAFWLLHGFN